MIVHIMWQIFQILAASLASFIVILLWVAIIAMIREAVNGEEEE